MKELRAIADALQPLTASLIILEAELPEGCTRDVVEKAIRLLHNTTKELRQEAAVLARGVEDL